mmetsp:Transcript_39476/g.122938  ORF Transcript_39476/g.122938 Transcript_39476/m.122938 type:complete len:222 (-) Transcript_39476:624-1289(-)
MSGPLRVKPSAYSACTSSRQGGSSPGNHSTASCAKRARWAAVKPDISTPPAGPTVADRRSASESLPVPGAASAGRSLSSTHARGTVGTRQARAAVPFPASGAGGSGPWPWCGSSASSPSSALAATARGRAAPQAAGPSASAQPSALVSGPLSSSSSASVGGVQISRAQRPRCGSSDRTKLTSSILGPLGPSLVVLPTSIRAEAAPRSPPSSASRSAGGGGP